MRYFIVGLLLAAAAPLSAQSAGAIAGRVRDADGTPLRGAEVLVDQGRWGARSDSSGTYRIREVRGGWHHFTARLIGYRAVVRDSVLVQAGATTGVDFLLQPTTVTLEPLVVSTPIDSILDPLATATTQKITAADLHNLPVSSLAEAVALSAGAVGQSYRGGRVGEEAFVIDGLGVKNQLDASTGGIGLRLPPDALTEASLVTNGFSARYGQAVSGLINVVTKDGGDHWSGRLAYETDRPFGQGWDYGLDRGVLEADGPLIGGIKAVVAFDATGRLDADPVSAPAPTNVHDPRTSNPYLLPHNSGEDYTGFAKLTIPLGERQTARLSAVRSIDQRLLYDPAYKYDEQFAPGQRVGATLLSGQIQHTSGAGASLPFVADLRVGYFDRKFIRGALIDSVPQKFGAFTFRPFHFYGETIAQQRDTTAAAAAIPGLGLPGASANTAWGVPAFFLGYGSRSDLDWNRFRELRGQLDLTFGLGSRGDLLVGGEVVRQIAETFQRAFPYLPVGDSVPPASAARFTPLAVSGYAEMHQQFEDLGFTAGLRYDRFDTRVDLRGEASRPQQALNPRFAVSTVLKGATVVASLGRFSQAPDYQYLVDAAFDDTLRTGRFRQGNPNLGFEQSWQAELSVRTRIKDGVTLRSGVYVKRLEGLVASVPLAANPDSTIFGNGDAGTVKGLELLFDREIRNGWGVRVAYTLQSAQATATSAFLLRRLIQIDTLTHDTIIPAKAEFPLDYDRRHSLTVILQGRISPNAGPRVFGVRPLAGFEASGIIRYNSGLPYSLVDSTGQISGPPNDNRLPATSTIDLLVRRPLDLAGVQASIYFDGRNLLNRRNIVAVRRDNGQLQPDATAVNAAAQRAYDAAPGPIPFESPRYRAWADLNGNGVIEGATELLPLYQAAARDYYQPLFFYGAPRLVRLGMEVLF